MPLYEYRCTSCGYKFEKIQKFSDAPEQVCPKCGGELVRPMSAPALKFEGAGWYINDYAPKATPATGGEAESEGKASEAPSTAASSASESSSGSGSGGAANAGSTSTGSSGSSSPATAS